MPSGSQVIKDIRGQIEEVDPSGVFDLQAQNGSAPDYVIVDVREQGEWEQGHIPGAVHVPRGHLESRIERAAPDRSQRVILYCATGQRSALAANTMEKLMGYE